MTRKAVGEPDYKAVFERGPALYLVLNPELTILAASDAYLQATLTRREDIVGRHLFDVFPDNPDDPSADSIRNTRASMNRVLTNHVADTMVVQRHDVRRDDGGFDVRYWSPVNVPILHADGSLAYIVHRVENVTDFVLLRQQGIDQSKQTEALRERALQTEGELYTRSREVAEASIKLKQANDELGRLYARTRELDELKSRFFANVSHELRTPLALILSPVERLLRRESLEDDARHDLLVVQRNARLLHRHVNDLLDIAKLEAGRMGIHYTRVDLAAFARLTASYFETLAADRRIRYEVQAPPVLMADADIDKLERMLINLLSNAFKFTPEGGAISLIVEEHSEHARIHVEDTGPGVPPALREAIFERFLQAEGGTDRRHGGTGLGLAIVREFAALHGGTVSVSEAEGGGACFTLELPLAAPAGTPMDEASAAPVGRAMQDAVDELQARPAAASPAPTADVPSAHILIAEDNPDMNEFLASVLDRHYRVSRAFDGRQGLEMALADPPDLILSDVMMPGMSGDRLVEELRRHSGLDDVPIVMLTAKADDELRTKLLRHGVQDYLHKPFLADELLARVGRLLADRRRANLRLQKSEEHFRVTFEQAAVGLAHVALDGRWLRVNQKLCDIVGYTRDELLASRFQDITHADDLDADLEQVRRLQRGDIDHYRMEKRYLRKDGTQLWINLTGALVRDESGAPEYFIAVIEDISRRKADEAEIRRLNADLERRVDERTAELKAANRELDSFAYAVSHDLRGPLRAMSGLSEALIEDYGDRLTGDASVYLEQIRVASRRMSELIEGLLALSRSTRADLRRDPVDLTDLCQRIVAELAAGEPARKVEVDVQPGLVGRGDPRMIEVVMRNLLGNAWKYTGRIAHPRISVFAQDRDGARCFCVADNGAGFDMAHAGKLFEPFQRLHREDEFPGLGIGLATVQRIIHRHGGSLRAEGAPGRGATFCFSLDATTTPPRG